MALDQPQDPNVGALQKAPEQARIEARAKIFWGSPKDEAVKYLQLHGITYHEAILMADAMVAEREKVIRGRGVRKICLGVAMMLVPMMAYLSLASVGYIDFRLLSVAVVVGFVGAWFCLKGTFMVVSPQTELGDVSE